MSNDVCLLRKNTFPHTSLLRVLIENLHLSVLQQWKLWLQPCLVWLSVW